MNINAISRVSIVAGLFLIGAAWSVPVTASGKSAGLHFTTENYPPFNMREGSSARIVGISTDIVRALMSRAGQPYRISFLPWQRAFNDALTKPGTCVYSTTETAERKPKFQWIGPLVKNDWIFFGRSDTSIVINTMEDAKRYTVGGYKGDAVALFLKREGFKQDLAAFDRLNPAKLKAGRFELWATGGHLGPYLAARAGVAIKPLFTFKETVMSIACNRDVDPALINRLNAVLVDLKQDGTVEQILTRYR